MKKILLVCCAGMSTSLLVTRMEKEAQEQGLDVKIWATNEKAIAKDWEQEPADVVLVGPQIRYLLNRIKKDLNNAVPIELIDMRTYGMMDGKKILKQGLDAIENANK